MRLLLSLIESLTNFLRDGCSHAGRVIPRDRKQRCIDCGMFRFHNFHNIGAWRRDSVRGELR